MEYEPDDVLTPMPRYDEQWRRDVVDFYGGHREKPEVYDRFAVWKHWMNVWRRRIAEKYDNSIVVTGVVGGGKCWNKRACVLMYDGTTKNIADVVVSDVLMGPDSKPRVVQRLWRGRSPMRRVVPRRGMDPFVVTPEHKLVLRRSYNGRDETAEISVEALQKNPRLHINDWKLYGVGIDFISRTVPLPLDPYLVGILLGDGSLTGRGSVAVTTSDTEIVAYLKTWCAAHGMVALDCFYHRASPRTATVRMTKINRAAYPSLLVRELRRMGLLPIARHERFVPQPYKTSSREERLQLLAGLLDTDGYLYRHSAEFVSKSPWLAEDVAFIARSLGFAATRKRARKGCQTGAVGTYYRVHIRGDLSLVPLRIERKRAMLGGARPTHYANRKKRWKDPWNVGFDIEDLPEDDYYGVEVDGDHLHLMSNFMVSSNSTGALKIGLDLADGQLNLQRDVLYALDGLLSRIEHSKPGDVVVGDEAVLIAQARPGGTDSVFILERALTLSRELGVTLILCIPDVRSLARGVRERRVEYWLHCEDRGYITVHELTHALSYKMDNNQLPFIKARQPWTHLQYDKFDEEDPFWIEYSRLKHKRTLDEIHKALLEVQSINAKHEGRGRRSREEIDEEAEEAEGGENVQRIAGDVSELFYGPKPHGSGHPCDSCRKIDAAYGKLRRAMGSHE